MSDEYNGWSNWETWCANLWLSNDEGTYSLCMALAKDCEGAEYPRTALAASLELMVDEWAENGVRLIGDDLTAWRIDWYEIAGHWADDYREAQGYEATA